MMRPPVRCSSLPFVLPFVPASSVQNLSVGPGARVYRKSFGVKKYTQIITIVMLTTQPLTLMLSPDRAYDLIAGLQ